MNVLNSYRGKTISYCKCRINSLSPLISPRKEKKKVNLLTFNKKLKLYLRDEGDVKYRKAFEKIREKNNEELYYDYDKKNQKIKKETFSGNNAKVLKNKILFVKEVMDYMVPRMLMAKMNYIKQSKEKEYQRLKHKNDLKENTIYLKTVPSANDNIKSLKHKIHSFSRNSINNINQLSPHKRILVNNTVVIPKMKKYNFLP